MNIMVVKNFRTPIRPIFWLSAVAAAYPVARYSKIYSLATVILTFAAVGSLFLDEYMAESESDDARILKNITTTPVTTQAPVVPQTTMGSVVEGDVTFSANTDLARTIWYWMENLQNLEDTLLCFILLFGYQSYRKNDINDVLDTIRKGHDRLINLGVTPKYRNWRGLLLILISIVHAYLGYWSVFQNEKTYFLFTVKKITAAVLPRFICHIYIVQFFCLMELVQDQVQCLTNGLEGGNQRYLESVVNIQSHLMNSGYCVFDMYMKFVSTCIVHSTISILLHAYNVSQRSKPFYAILVVFELLVLFRIIHACARTQSLVDQFNVKLFKLMRTSNDLCDNKKLYLYLISKQTVSFSAGGFFEIAYSTIVSIVAAVTTYLVIVIQLSKPTSVEEEPKMMIIYRNATSPNQENTTIH